jgi:hypothetical protein
LKTKTQTILIFVLGSIVFLAIPILVSPDLTRPGNMFRVPPFQRDFLSYVLLLAFFYLNYFVLIPKLYSNKKYMAYVASLILIFILTEALSRMAIPEHFRPMRAPHGGFEPGHRPPPFRSLLLLDASRHFFLFLFVVFFSLMFKIKEQWKKSQKEKTDAELNFLKAQINPHFLFNTLNSIYYLAIDKSDYTATAVVKLSGMMRYVLSEANQEFVSLDKEINYINDYIELQQLRLGHTVKLDYKVKGNLNGKKIAPLVLMPFIENAFKYGVNPEENSDIQILIEINEKSINLSVTNKKVQTTIEKQVKSGLGIENTKLRLQLLYPAAHFLRIDNNEDEFIVSLSIQLHD